MIVATFIKIGKIIIMDFVDFNLAKKLKEKGFNKECFGWYYPNKVCGFDHKTTIVFNGSPWRGSNYKDMLVLHDDEKHIDVPTISQVLKWLREEKKIHIQILFTCPPDKWEYITVKMTNNELHGMCASFTSYEKAAIAGIEYTIDKLI